MIKILLHLCPAGFQLIHINIYAQAIAQLLPLANSLKQVAEAMDDRKDARMRSLQDARALDALIKVHLLEEPSKCTDLWKTDDIEDTVEHFNAFLCNVAGKGFRLSKSFFLKRLKKFFQTDAVTLEDFAGKLTQALRYCHGKAKRLVTGKKTSTACLKVVTVYGFKTGSAASSNESLQLPTASSDEDLPEPSPSNSLETSEVCEVETSEDEDTGALAALAAAKNLYKDYTEPLEGSRAASSADLVDLTCCSPVKTPPQERPQVPYINIACFRILMAQ